MWLFYEEIINCDRIQTGYWEIISNKEIKRYNNETGKEFEYINEYHFQNNYNELDLGAFVFIKQ